ncbi:Tripartite-type tricarboxylate transporter, receptor component TctC [Noviherbaspirillum humi]|uniref:Tripartite-type tricarboxylate transporter, receptor component TctC n=1 Tax=Noviherbaspirillum humi TaxID=1688639 RepID=A0A239I0M4_9BURK|nr:tripartite tricarboxylate transporter substrate binding protein [Noviherbaspirillum humi]SNS87376.1 Tripartite-type tricarboxylate transporter, receptor component TctC [Noviherbaspirillum humi]
MKKTLFRAARLGHASVMALALMAAGGAAAQGSYPSKPVNIYTPFAVGSGPDAVLRQVADRLSKMWKQPVIINNKPGAGGFLAFESTQRAAPDGYTLLQLDSEHLAAVPYLYKSRNFQTLDVYEPVATLFRTPFLISVPTDSSLKSVKDLVAAAKAAPGRMSYGSWGIGSPGHLGGEALELATGTTMQHVPYREVSQLYGSVASNDVQWAFASIPSSQGVFKAGKIRYIAVAAPKRIPQMPNVPTVAESGGPADLDVNSFVVLVSPKGMPADLKTKINADVQKVLADPEIKERFNTFAFEVLNWTPEEIRRNADAKARIYSNLIQRKNLTLE